MKPTSSSHYTGFTLIEVIVTIMLFAIFGTLMFSYLGSALTQSAVPMNRLQSATELQAVLEKITADYRQKHRAKVWQASTDYLLNSIVIPTSTDKVTDNTNNAIYFYKNTSAGKSGTTEPAWPTSNTTIPVDGDVLWIFYPNLDALKTKIGSEGGLGNPSYGNYSVVYNRFVERDSNNKFDLSTREDILKVTISLKNSLGEQLTVLFSGL